MNFQDPQVSRETLRRLDAEPRDPEASKTTMTAPVGYWGDNRPRTPFDEPVDAGAITTRFITW